MTSLSDVSLPSRVAEPGEGIGTDELGLAARNHGMPLELMRHDLTPLGAHYLLTHYDIPFVPADTYRLEITGAVRRSLTLELADLRSRPAVTTAVTMECAGNGRARFTPRPVSQPWLQEAVGTMAWTGTPLAPLLQEAGVEDDAVDIAVHRRRPRGRARCRAGLPALAAGAEGARRVRAAGLGVQRGGPAAPARRAAAPRRARLVRHGVGEVADPDRSRDQPPSTVRRCAPTGCGRAPTRWARR